ncbi:MAG: hypothetical protein PSV46_08550 [Reyranella sp.]|nr:hypothetical protein [Reyranella sp.]
MRDKDREDLRVHWIWARHDLRQQLIDRAGIAKSRSTRQRCRRRSTAEKYWRRARSRRCRVQSWNNGLHGPGALKRACSLQRAGTLQGACPLERPCTLKRTSTLQRACSLKRARTLQRSRALDGARTLKRTAALLSFLGLALLLGLTLLLLLGFLSLALLLRDLRTLAGRSLSVRSACHEER